MSTPRSDDSWPRARLGEAVVTLARLSGLSLRSTDPPATPRDGDLEDWLVSAGSYLGIEVQPVTLCNSEIEDFLRSGAPAILGLPGDRFLLVTGGGSKEIRVIDEGGRSRSLKIDALDREADDEPRNDFVGLLASLDLAPDVYRRAKERLSAAQRGDLFPHRVWLVKESPEALRDALRDSRLGPLSIAFASTYAMDYGLFVLSWWLIGRGALNGRIDWGWLTAWALVFMTMLPFRMLSTWFEGRIAVAAGGLLKRRLLLGAMRLEPDETRQDGTGRHLARVFESEAVESLALSGGLLSLAALLELVVSGAVLAMGAGGPGHAFVLLATLVGLFFLTSRYYAERRRWTDSRLQASHEFVELMVGHRTRLAQRPPEEWHDEEDESLAAYLDRSRKVDRLDSFLAVAHRAWLPIGLLGLSPAMVGGGASVGRMAIGLGGTILAARAFKKLTDGLSKLLDAAIAWSRVKFLFTAASREPWPGEPNAQVASAADTVTAENLHFQYPGRVEATIRDIRLRVGQEDRVLLTAPSGGGKSTLLSLLNGLRVPSSGQLRLRGVDRKILGSHRWTRRVATAPQFHENYVFTETFAFNLLMGRRWPPSWEDWQEAERLARELGLGELLAKMPGGMNQLVGETGWQLSHGERSRLFLARALLQGGDLVLLDESFAALDPENLHRALTCARARSKALVVVAHP
jgi:ATP-binding cassette subfamily B protein